MAVAPAKSLQEQAESGMNWKIAAMVLVVLSGLVSLSPIVEAFRTWLLRTSQKGQLLVSVGAFLSLVVVAAVITVFVAWDWFLNQVWQWGKEGFWWKQLLGLVCMTVVFRLYLKVDDLYSVRTKPPDPGWTGWENVPRLLDELGRVIIKSKTKRGRLLRVATSIGGGVMFASIGWGIGNAAVPILIAGVFGAIEGAALLPLYVFRTLRRLFHSDTSIYAIGVLLLAAASAIQIFVLAP